MTVVLDAGALIAVERGDKEMAAIIKRERQQRRLTRTHAGIVGQVWRGGRGRQVNVTRALAGAQIDPIDDELGRRAGALLGQVGASDVIDAALVLLAHDGDEIFTSDPTDLLRLAQAADLHIDLIEI